MTFGRGMDYSWEETQHLVEYLAEACPSKAGRNGNAVYEALARNAIEYPWSKSRTWQSWRNHFIANETTMNSKIRRYQRRQEAQEVRSSKDLMSLHNRPAPEWMNDARPISRTEDLPRQKSKATQSSHLQSSARPVIQAADELERGRAAGARAGKPIVPHVEQVTTPPPSRDPSLTGADALLTAAEDFHAAPLQQPRRLSAGSTSRIRGAELDFSDEIDIEIMGESPLRGYGLSQWRIGMDTINNAKTDGQSANAVPVEQAKTHLPKRLPTALQHPERRGLFGNGAPQSQRSPSVGSLPRKKTRSASGGKQSPFLDLDALERQRRRRSLHAHSPAKSDSQRRHTFGGSFPPTPSRPASSLPRSSPFRRPLLPPPLFERPIDAADVSMDDIQYAVHATIGSLAQMHQFSLDVARHIWEAADSLPEADRVLGEMRAAAENVASREFGSSSPRSRSRTTSRRSSHVKPSRTSMPSPSSQRRKSRLSSVYVPSDNEEDTEEEDNMPLAQSSMQRSSTVRISSPPVASTSRHPADPPRETVMTTRKEVAFKASPPRPPPNVWTKEQDAIVLQPDSEEYAKLIELKGAAAVRRRFTDLIS